MGTRLSVCITGAGSSYTPEMIEGLLGSPDEHLPVNEIRLHDIDGERLEVMAGLTRRMLAAVGRTIVIRQGLELAPLLDGVDFVITQVRVGGMDARAHDEKIPLKYDIIGQETTGPGGMFKALRTIPVMIEIARLVERVAPRAFILNYTNPSGIITEAVSRHTGARIIGLCSGIPGLQARIRDHLHDTLGSVQTYCVGLNHLGFVNRFMAGGRDVTDTALERLMAKAAVADDHAGLAPPAVIRTLRAVPLASYLNLFLNRRQAVVQAQARTTTRADEIRDLEHAIFAEARDPGTVTKPASLAGRGGGGYADVTLQFMRAIAFDLGEELVCTVPNRGAVEGIEAAAGVEVVCRVDGTGAHPLPVGPVPLPLRGLVQAVKAYETLTVEAAVTRRRLPAVQALVNHPLVGDLQVAEALVDEMLAAHGLHFQ